MNTLQSFLQEFAIFKSPENSEVQDTNDMEFDVPSQGDNDTDVENLPSDQPTDNQDGETCQCQCDCPCCQKARASDDEGSTEDPNIEVIDPEEGGFDIDDETGMEDDEDSDPTKDYDLF